LKATKKKNWVLAKGKLKFIRKEPWKNVKKYHEQKMESGDEVQNPFG